MTFKGLATVALQLILSLYFSQSTGQFQPIQALSSFPLHSYLSFMLHTVMTTSSPTKTLPIKQPLTIDVMLRQRPLLDSLSNYCGAQDYFFHVFLCFHIMEYIRTQDLLEWGKVCAILEMLASCTELKHELKSITIKPLSAPSKVPEGYFEKAWGLLQQAVAAIFQNKRPETSSEILYRVPRALS